MARGVRKHSTRRRPVTRREKRVISLACIALALVMLGLAIYIAGWYDDRARIRNDAGRYQAMYNPEPTATVSATEAPPTSGPLPTPTPEPSPAATLEPTPETAAPAAEPEDISVPAAVDELLPTPNPDTLVYALPTAPPVQESFAALIAGNPETIGFLDIDGMLSLPVAQRENDNDYYLEHNFDGEESKEGALFLDGLNRLVPEDDCLIVYGHNMKNGTMFGDLDDFESLAYLKKHPVIRFDTLYENRLYAPFAAFTASMEVGDSHYFDVRQFIFDEAGFELFTLKMQSRSVYDIPIDVRYGDRLLLLVTCDYTNRDGRFILALRQLREGEREADLGEIIGRARAK